MKNIFRLMGVALLACSMIMVSCKKDDEKDEGGQGGGGGQTTSSYSVTFDGTALDVAGFSSAQTAYNANYDVQIWLFQCAMRAEGQTVYFPYAVTYLYGSTTAEMEGTTELYKDTHYTAGDESYGDWQCDEIKSVNFTTVDLTSYKLSGTLVTSNYDLGEYIEGISNLPEDATEEDEAAVLAGCTHKDVALTLNNVAFTPANK